MKMASLWKTGTSEDHTSFNTWVGTLVTTVEVDHPLAAIFLTLNAPSQRLLNWLESRATGPVTIQHLDDGRSVIAVSNRFDSFTLRSDFGDHLDLGVVSTTSSPERIRDFITNLGRKDA